MNVVQSMWAWLPMTMQWMYRQLSAIETVRSAVLADSVTNLELFPIGAIFPVPSGSRRMLIRAEHRLGVRRLTGAQRRAVIRFSPDLLHSHFGDRGWRDSKWAARLGVPQVVSFYGLDVDFIPERRPAWERRYQDLFAHAARVLCLGPVMRQRLISRGCPPGKIQIHHVGVDVEQIQFMPRSYQPNRPLRVLVASSFREKKGIPLAIRAVARARKRIDVELTIIGDADSDRRSLAERAKIIDAIEREGVSDVTSRIGFLPHAKLMETAYDHDVFLAPSLTAADGDQEGTPVVIMDMMASGLPVVTTRHSDIPEVVDAGISGLMAEEGDVEGLASHLVALAEDPARWGAVTEAARRKIEREFNNRIQAMRLLEIYREAL